MTKQLSHSDYTALFEKDTALCDKSLTNDDTALFEKYNDYTALF